MNIAKKYDAVALYSGGTDSTVSPILAKERISGEILLLMIDLGCTPESIQQARERAKILNMDFEIINGVREFADRFLSEAIRMNASYFGYPLGTPLGRAFMMELALKFLKENKNTYKYIIHGCNANQNTRYRIEKLCKNEENIFPIGPLVEAAYTREEKCEILAQNKIITTTGDNYAQDENIFCRALEGDIFNELTDVQELGVYRIVADLESTPDQGDIVKLTFEKGIPVKLNDQPLPLDEIIIKMRDLGARHGIGRIISLEETIPELGYKERGVYEAPASVILNTAHQYLESIVLNKIERMVKKDLDQKWADVVYRGDWYGSERKAISEFCHIFSSLKKILECNQRSIKALNIQNAVCHAEYFLTPGGEAFFGELATRIGGGPLIGACIQNTHGINIYQSFIDIELGNYQPAPPRFTGKYTGFICFPSKEGVITALSGADDFKHIEGIIDFKLRNKTGDRITAVDNSAVRTGHAIVEAEDYETLKAKLLQIFENFRLEIAPPGCAPPWSVANS